MLISIVKSLLIGASCIGITVFSAIFSVTFFDQETITKSAKQFVVEKTQETYLQYEHTLAEHGVAKKALTSLKDKYSRELADVPQAMKTVDTIITAFIESMCAANDCVLSTEESHALKRTIVADYAKSMRQAANTALYSIDDILLNKARTVMSELIEDLRIFSAINAVIYGCVLLIALCAKPITLRALQLPAVLMIAASLAATFIYVCEQNWFYSILYNNYWGTGYAVLVGVIFAFLLDIVMNSAKVTVAISNALSALAPRV